MKFHNSLNTTCRAPARQVVFPAGTGSSYRHRITRIFVFMHHSRIRHLFMVPLIAVLGCAPPLTTTGDKATSTPDARVVAFAEIVRMNTVPRPGPTVIIDSSSLRKKLHMDSAAIADVSGRLPELRVGIVPVTGVCAPAEPELSCIVIRVSSFTEHQGFQTMKVGWYRVGGCYSSESTYRVSVRGTSVDSIDILETDIAHCGPGA